MIENTVELRVIYGDTDQMGVVYYANYLRFFEAARGAFLHAAGRPYRDIEASGVQMPVMEAGVKYLRPALYDDVISVTARVEAVRGASMRFSYRVRRGEETLAEGFTEHACVGKNGRPVRFPQELRDLLGPPPGV